MENRTLHFILSSLLCMALGACTKDAEMDVPISDQQIMFETETLSSRGFLDTQSLETTGTKLSLYGFLDGAPLSDGSTMELQGKSLTFTDVSAGKHWRVMDGTTPLHYYWAENGSYKFYAWLDYDADGALSVPDTWTYDAATEKLTIPETVVNKDYNQFDFIYSELYVREYDQSTPDEDKYAVVPLAFNHLYSAFSVGARNSTSEDVTITKVALEGIHDRGSAIIDYSGNAVAVSYGETSIARSSDTPFIEYEGYEGAGYLLPKNNGVVGNAFTNATNRMYYMIWPQPQSIVAPTTPVTGDENREYAATDSLLVVEYTMAGIDYKKRVKFPDMDWEAGKRYHFDIQFADKLVALTATVNPWSYSSSEVDYQESAILVKETGRLQWDESTCIVNDEQKKVFVNQGQPIVASFVIDAPVGGQWKVSLEGDVQAFVITDDVHPINDAMGPIDSQQHVIRITPKISNPERDYVAQLKFVVLTADGQVIAVDEMIQDVDGNHSTNDIYQLVLPNAN